MGSIIDGVLVIANGTLIDGTGTEPRPNGTIVVRGTTIVEVHAAKPPGFDPRATMIDATGKFILPGLIDGHVHLSMYQGAPAGITSPTSAEFCTLRAAEHLLPMLRAGVTAVQRQDHRRFPITAQADRSAPASRGATTIEAIVRRPSRSCPRMVVATRKRMFAGETELVDALSPFSASGASRFPHGRIARRCVMTQISRKPHHF
jgi:cytosine/adenosine deaminase-related metal-dependent hydrolase